MTQSQIEIGPLHRPRKTEIFIGESPVHLAPPHHSEVSTAFQDSASDLPEEKRFVPSTLKLSKPNTRKQDVNSKGRELKYQLDF